MSSPVQFRSSAINASDCVSKAWSLISPHFALFVGMTVVLCVISIAVSLIPYAGSIINFLLSPPLLCGILLALLTVYRGESPAFSQLFEGFNYFIPVVLIQVIQSLPWIIFAVGGVVFASFAQEHMPMPSADGKIDFNLFLPLILIYIVLLLLSLITYAIFFFAVPLVIDRGVGVIDAVKLSAQAAVNNLGGLFLLLLLEILIAIGGTLLICIGLLFAIPLIYAINIVAYKEVFPDDRQIFESAPPRPEDYGNTFGFGQ